MNDVLSDPAAPGPLRLFLVEDSLIIRDLVLKNLSNIPGLIVAGVADSERDALTQLALHSFDVLIVDIELKQGNGMSLLRALIKLPQYAASVKIIFSNNVSDFYRRVGKQYGVQFFFDKSSDFLQMRAVLQELAACSHLN